MSFYVINNGCDINYKAPTKNIRKEYGILGSDFLFLFVGNITRNKNQLQVVEALKLISTAGIKNIKCLFIGGGEVESLIQEIKRLNVQDMAVVVGFIEKKYLFNYYNAADATILTSHTEGFGLSIIEGYVYGKPNLTFADLPAVKDLYCEYTMLLCKCRANTELAKSMIKMSNCKWDRERIKQYSKKFSLNVMAESYIEMYYKILYKK